MCGSMPIHSCAQPRSTTSFTNFPECPAISLQYQAPSSPVFPLLTPAFGASQTTIQIPQRTASAANASGFLLVSLSKTLRLDFFQPQTPLAEAFPIKASDHSRTDCRHTSVLCTGTGCRCWHHPGLLRLHLWEIQRLPGSSRRTGASAHYLHNRFSLSAGYYRTVYLFILSCLIRASSEQLGTYAQIRLECFEEPG